MIVIAIGQSGAGKSTAIENKYLKDDMRLTKQPVKHTHNDNICLIGDYLVDRRCTGTDTLPFDALPDIIEFIENNKNKYSVIVVEGDRITNKRFFKSVIELGDIFKVYYFNCSLQTSLERLTDPNESFVKTTKTKSENVVNWLRIKDIAVSKIETD